MAQTVNPEEVSAAVEAVMLADGCDGEWQIPRTLVAQSRRLEFWSGKANTASNSLNRFLNRLSARLKTLSRFEDRVNETIASMLVEVDKALETAPDCAQPALYNLNLALAGGGGSEFD